MNSCFFSFVKDLKAKRRSKVSH